MKIAFLCSSLAAGRDGVGDYVRLLASSCEADGHECLLVALNDRHLPGQAVLTDGGTLQFPHGLPWRSRATLLRRALGEFRPDWVSWQIVSYGFSPRGIIPGQVHLLAEAAGEWRQHVMLHELWLGIARSEGPRARILGALQRFHLSALLERLKPARLHTSNEAYQSALRHVGWESGLLPLFGNIPVAATGRADAEEQLRALAGEKLPEGPVAFGILFGTLHPQWNVDETLAWLDEASRASGRRIVLFAAGRSGLHAKSMLDRLNRGGRVLASALGELPARRISAILQGSDFGIATHPWALIGKSGTTATLLEHGLPVLVPRDDWHLRGGPTPGPDDPLLARMRDASPRDFSSFLSRRREPSPRLAETSTRFCTELSGQPVIA
jgi:hypothetical protein